MVHAFILDFKSLLPNTKTCSFSCMYKFFTIIAPMFPLLNYADRVLGNNFACLKADLCITKNGIVSANSNSTLRA